MRKYCQICAGSLTEIIDLGGHPFADTFIPEILIHKPDLVYPLVVAMCEDPTCGHIQTVYETDPKDRYCNTEYSYTSSNSTFSKNHWTKFAEDIIKRCSSQSKILEIGSNDGFLLERFKKDYSFDKVLGVDPSATMCDLAYQRGISTVKDLFSKRVATRICKSHGRFDVVIANNVLNHAEDAYSFVSGVYDVLPDNKDSLFVFEVPYWLEAVKAERFDQVYHEHVSYFTVKSVLGLFDMIGFVIDDIEVVDYHGGSLRVFAKKYGEQSAKVAEMIKAEEKMGLFDLKTYLQISKTHHLRRDLFVRSIYEANRAGRAVVFIGAAAKGNTLINYCKLDKTSVSYITDASPYKKGKYLPLSRIPIVDDSILTHLNNPVVSILAWNLEHILKDKLKEFNKDIEYIKF